MRLGRGSWPGFPSTRAVRCVITCLLALFLPVCNRADAKLVPGTEVFSLAEADHRKGFEDLPEGFHNDVDSVTVAAGGHHTCALEFRPGVDFGGPVRCWGRNDWGQSSPPGDIFVQVIDGAIFTS